MDDKRVEAAARVICLELNGTIFRDADNNEQDEAIFLATASIKASDAAAWQPIETAPRDGTLILVAVKHIGCDVVSFWGAGWRETTNGLMLRDEPTHWQPLPAPPSDAA